ncbi:NAD(P)-dependent oxidoreductase [Pelagibius sp.]|uniref:NAD(P)-dependent oxidoreductase n=1 Tax=Pelagibius sp. TaxID=1931238 RepID=UPI003BAF19BF
MALVDDPRSAFPLGDALQEDFEIVWLRERYRPATMAAKDVLALVTTTNAGADAALIDAFPALELVAVAGGHVDRIDSACLAARGIPLCATPGLSAGDVADFAMALILASLRGLCIGDRLVRAGHWGHTVPPLGRSLPGTRLGILGLGSIGGQLALRAAAFGMDIAYSGPRHKPNTPWPFIGDLARLAGSSDVLAVTCRSGPKTRGIIDGDVLNLLGPSAVLVSIARGAVDQTALIEALADDRLGGAALDVVADEPNAPAVLRRDPRVIVTPHMASKTARAKTASASLIRDNLRAHFAGQRLLTPVL